MTIMSCDKSKLDVYIYNCDTGEIKGFGNVIFRFLQILLVYCERGSNFKQKVKFQSNFINFNNLAKNNFLIFFGLF